MISNITNYRGFYMFGVKKIQLPDEFKILAYLRHEHPLTSGEVYQKNKIHEAAANKIHEVAADFFKSLNIEPVYLQEKVRLMLKYHTEISNMLPLEVRESITSNLLTALTDLAEGRRY